MWKSVSMLLYLTTLTAFNTMLRMVRRSFIGCRCVAYRVINGATITWQTLLVLLCEVKQCLNRYSYDALKQITKAVRKASDRQLRCIREWHAGLLQMGYAGGSKCHAVYMVEKAAEVLQADFVKMTKAEKDRQKRRTQTEMHGLLKDFAFCQLSPKLSTLFIPEYRTMEAFAQPHPQCMCTDHA